MTHAPVAGKTVFITGAARGIGAAAAREFAARGAHVALVGRSAPGLEKLAAELGPDHAWFVADVTDQDALDRAATAAAERFGSIDVLVANAGINIPGTILSADSSDFHRVIDTNLVGVYRTVQACVPHLVKTRGYIMVVSSLSAFAPVGGMGAYSAGKAGGLALIHVLRFELAHLGVGVGSIHPAWVGTDMLWDADRDMPTFRKLREGLPGPAGSVLTPEACGKAIADGVERRAWRICMPRYVTAVAIFRSAITTHIGDVVSLRLFGKKIRRTDEEYIANRAAKAEIPRPAGPRTRRKSTAGQ